MSQQRGLILVAAAALSLPACASTQLVTSWKAPDVQSLSFQRGDKVLAMVVSSEESSRRGSETDLARELSQRGLAGVPAYMVIPTDAIQKKDVAKSLVEASGAVGVVVMRVTGKDKQLSVDPGMYTGPYYGGFWGGYYSFGWGMAYTPGTVRTETIVSVETLVYDLRQDKLVWAGQSQTTNPSRVDALVKDVVAVAAAEIRKQGLIRPAVSK